MCFSSGSHQRDAHAGQAALVCWNTAALQEAARWLGCALAAGRQGPQRLCCSFRSSSFLWPMNSGVPPGRWFGQPSPANPSLTCPTCPAHPGAGWRRLNIDPSFRKRGHTCLCSSCQEPTGSDPALPPIIQMGKLSLWLQTHMYSALLMEGPEM